MTKKPFEEPGGNGGTVVLDSERLVDTVTAAERIWAQTFEAIGEGILVCDQQTSDPL